jgi:predicted MFS family arabinose efflux permease
MKKILIHFEKNNILNKKIVVSIIWIFSIVMLSILLAITYQELISEQLRNTGATIEILAVVALGVLLISGLLSASRTARWIILLIAYLTLVSPFVIYIMLKVFTPEIEENFWMTFILPNIIMSIFIIVLLSNRISLQLYSVKKDRKGRVKEQIYLFSLAIALTGLYTYYVYIPILFKTIN